MKDEIIKRVFPVIDSAIKLFDLLIRVGEFCVVLMYLAVGYAIYDWLTKEMPACK